MTIEDIFNKIASHMKEGIDYHEEMANAYNFLGLYGYARNQFVHQLEEIKNYQYFCNYFSIHYHKLIRLENFNKPEIIPENWYKYTTIAVDKVTRKNAIKDLINKWIKWEKSTKQLYDNMLRELREINDEAAALYIQQLLADVTKELSKAEQWQIKMETIDYDLIQIVEWSEAMETKYKKKLRW